MPDAYLPPFLDTGDAIKFDAANLASRIAELPEQVTRAQQEFAGLSLPSDLSQVQDVLFCGMGGSGIGAMVACDLPPSWIKKPIGVVGGYELPYHVGKGTLVVLVSYSGDTEEVLACLRQAQAVGARIVAVAGGGALIKEAQAAKLPYYQFNYRSQPRDAFGFLFAPLVKLLELTEVITKEQADLAPAVSTLSALAQEYAPGALTSMNRAKQLAYRLFDHLPLVVSGPVMAGVARRWKNQINEHAKSAAWFDTLPEGNHNTVEGFRWPARFKDDAIVVMLRSGFEYERVRLRQKLLIQHFAEAHIETEQVEARGDDVWGQKLSLLALGDWVSYYLALLYRTDPEDIPVIKKLKAGLAD